MLCSLPSSYVSFGSESDGGYMDMRKEDITEYVAMQELTDTIKYADIQPSPYESPYQQDIYQEQGKHTSRTKPWSKRNHEAIIKTKPSLISNS